jgi:hypothetical protein
MMVMSSSISQHLCLQEKTVLYAVDLYGAGHIACDECVHHGFVDQSLKLLHDFTLRPPFHRVLSPMTPYHLRSSAHFRLFAKALFRYTRASSPNEACSFVSRRRQLVMHFHQLTYSFARRNEQFVHLFAACKSYRAIQFT